MSQRHLRFHTDKQLASAIRILSPFNWGLWIKYHNISQLDSYNISMETPPEACQGEILDSSNPMSESNLAIL